LVVPAGSANNFDWEFVSMDITTFLNDKPSLSQIIETVEKEAQKRVAEIKKTSQGVKT